MGKRSRKLASVLLVLCLVCAFFPQVSFGEDAQAPVPTEDTLTVPEETATTPTPEVVKESVQTEQLSSKEDPISTVEPTAAAEPTAETKTPKAPAPALKAAPALLRASDWDGATLTITDHVAGSLAAEIAAALADEGISATAPTKLIIEGGEISEADWTYFRGQTAAVLPNVTSLDISGTTTTSLTYSDGTRFPPHFALSEAILPTTLTEIGSKAFANCAFTEVEFPSVVTIGSNAFASCTSLTTASFPTATTIGTQAFQSCTSLTTASFPTATTIGTQAFQDCDSFTTISFPNAETIGTRAFGNCENLQDISFPSVVTIGDNAFALCNRLKNASFPSVVTIGTQAFHYCISLITGSYPKAETIGENAFQNCVELTDISFPKATSTGIQAFINCTSLATASFPTATTIGAEAFQNCKRLTNASFPAAKTVGENAFRDTALTNVSFLAAETIGENAYYGCTSLTTATFPTATTIGNEAFYGCTSLATASFPESKTIGTQAFQGCTSLELFFAGTLPSVGDNAFANVPTDALLLYRASSTVDPAETDWGTRPAVAFEQLPQTPIVEAGTSFALTITNTSPLPEGLTFSWYNERGVLIPGVSGATLKFEPLLLAHAGYYYVRANYKNSTVSLSGSELTVTLDYISLDPGGLDLKVGEEFTLTASYGDSDGVWGFDPTLFERTEEGTTDGKATFKAVAPAISATITYTVGGVTGTANITAYTEADPADNTLSVTPTTGEVEDTFSLVAEGADQDLFDKFDTPRGTICYLPVSYTTSPLASPILFPEDGPYTAEFTYDAPGTYTVTVAYQAWRNAGEEWRVVEGAADTKTAEVTVTAPETPDEPEEPTVTPTPTPPADTTTPTVIPAAQAKTVASDTDATGDSTQAALLLFAAALIASVTVAVVATHRKKTREKKI